MGMGHVRRRGDKWVVVVDVGRDEQGRRRQRWHSGYRTKHDATEALKEISGRLQTKTYVAPAKVTVAAYLREWIAGAESTIRPSTWASYRLNVERHIIPALGQGQLQHLTTEAINTFYAHLLKDGRADRKGGLSAQTVGYIAMILKHALTEATNNGRLVRNPAATAHPPRTRGKAEMKTWTALQLRTFLDRIRDEPFYPALLFSATCGTRRGETLAIRWSDLDLDAGRVSIQQTLIAIGYDVQFGTPKTARGRRNISLDATTIAALREHRRHQLEARLQAPAYADLDLVFARPDGTPIHPERLTRTFEAFVRASGLPRIRLHDLRHTCASLMLSAGVPAKVASERLGHSSISITLDTYSHVLPGLQEDAAAKVEAAVWG